MCGQWRLSTGINSDWSIVHIKWDLSSLRARFFPFFFRDKEGTISYPTTGENWVCLSEYKAYLNNSSLYRGTVDVLEVWNFYPDTDDKPFEFIPEIAAQRLIWKKLYKDSGGVEGGQHMMVKCGLNGIFGKTVQTVGMFTDEDGIVHDPPFFNLFWGSWITSSTRARMFDAACQHPESVVMFATDGLFTTSERSVHLSNNLGDWEEPKTSQGMTFVQSGVYFSEHGEKTRGFKKGSITETTILEKWKNKEWKVEGVFRRFVTYGMIATSKLAESIEENMKRLASWEDVTRVLHLTPNGTKREYDPNCNPLQKGGPNPAMRLIPTIPRANDILGMSYPYEIDMVYLAEQSDRADEEQTMV
jgi:hypothetical protein